jgi:Carboxypeptidase regulatory-like domain
VALLWTSQRPQERKRETMRKNWVLFLCLFLIPAFAFAQATDGNLVGTITDATGAAVPNATLELTNMATGVKHTARSSSDGTYRFSNIPVGRYTLTATATGFNSAGLQGINIELSRTTTANLGLQVGAVQTTVEVMESGALIDTTTAQITSTYGAQQAIALPTTGLASGILNLSLLSAGVGSAGGYGLGEGPSVGGQRPRQNNFTIEGVDNNRRDVTGSTVEVPNEGVEQFSVLQNQFGAEFGHSTGGQFNTVIRGGTNDLHGTLYWYLRNRKLNAIDQSNARQGLTENPRFDENRVGASIGGPIIQNKLFYFGNYEYNPVGEQGSNSSEIFSPTAAGYTALAANPAVSRTNLDVLRTYLPPAATASGSTTVSGVSIPIGLFPVAKPQFQNNYRWLVSGDYNLSDKDQFRARYIDNRFDVIYPDASLPAFFVNRLTTAKLSQVTWFRNINPNLFNELRVAYRRFNDGIPVPDLKFPGLDAFPNIEIQQDLQVIIGPEGSTPQSGIENGYQLVNNVNWIRGRHAWKFGIDGRKYIASTRFIQRERGDYVYSNLQQYILDRTPDVLAERNLGGTPYSGNAIYFYWFVNDEIKLRPNLTLNLGLRHEYKGISAGDKLQVLNAVSSVPGVLDFREPKPEWDNFAPRVGIAYSPGTSGLTSIRAGFGIGHDVYFDNFGTLSKPVQLEGTIDDDTSLNRPGYLAGGGIRPDRRPAQLTPAEAKAFTSAYIADQKLPYSIQWNIGAQRVFASDYTAEVRYVGTRGVNLYTQHRINIQAPVTAERSLPTYLQRPSQADLDRLTLTLPALQALPFFTPQFAAAGFNQQPIVVFDARGGSIYHGLAMELTRRFTRGLLFKGAYTWSHAIDDSGADLFSTHIAPRRPQDFQNLRAERSSSILDHRHRFTMSGVYALPFFRNSTWVLKNLVGNWDFSGIYTYESPQLGTVQSGVDSNLNRDAAGDRTIINPSGVKGTGSAVTPLTNSAGQRVAYLANNPNAQYIVAGVGAYANGGRSTLPIDPINNFDLQLAKRVNVTESKAVEFRASFVNALNHPQYTPGYPSTVRFRSRSTTRNNLVPGTAQFNRPDLVYESNSREIHLGLRIVF